MSSFENFVKCRVVSPLAAGATDIALYEAVAPFNLPPEEGGVLVLTDSPNNPSVIEVIRYGYRSALGLYDVQRGQEGTSAVAWTGPVYCYQSLMAGDFQALLDSKVDKAVGESLMLDAERTKLAGIAAGAQVNSVTSVAGRTGAVTLAKADVGLGSVDNTSDANKPVSTAQQVALNAKAPLASPALTGTPTAPTPAAGTNTTQIATAAFVQAALAALVNGAPGALDQLSELAAAMGNDPNFATTMLNALALKAPLNSPALTGNPTAPTPASTDNDESIATTAFVRAAVALFGLGSSTVQPVPGGDLNNVADTGFNRFDNVEANRPCRYGTVMTIRRTAQDATQIAFDRFDALAVYVRRQKTGVWDGWGGLFHNQNILGTVSQSGGVPTGAIIESGTNANGSYERYASGLQICTSPTLACDITTTSVNVFRSAGTPWTFPAVFIATPHTAADTNNNSNTWGNCPKAAATTTTALLFGFASSSIAGVGITGIAIGRWF